MSRCKRDDVYKEEVQKSFERNKREDDFDASQLNDKWRRALEKDSE